MDDVRVTLLGGFSAAVGGAPVPEGAWRLRKARDLVKLLALAPGHRLHREQVMDALWRDRDLASAANNLHQAVHAARRALGRDALEVRDEVIRLSADVDVDRFRRLATEARASRAPVAFRNALEAYGGELLPENRYDDWATAHRDELERLAGQIRDAAEELGGLASLRRSSLPADSSSFVGRERELSELHALLAHTRMLTLSGTGGVGKTRLVLELARAVEGAYADGAVLVELAAVSDPDDVIEAVANALDLRPLPGSDIAATLASFLGSRSQLLVLDNCEHVLGAASSLVETLLRAAPGLSVLCTSREPLHVAGEVVFRVPSLDIPDPDEGSLSWQELLGFEAVRLFVERAAAVSPGFAASAVNTVDIARICFRLDGLPLALELAAGRVGALDPSDIAVRLDDRFRLLRRGGEPSPTRQHTLHATLQWSHDLLTPDERVLFRRLAVFAGGFRLEAVEAVCTGGLLSEPRVADVLARLVEKSLVTVDDSGSCGRRYRLLDTVHLYALERLREAGEATEIALRHARWALGLAESGEGSQSLDREVANFRAALDTLIAIAPAEALRLCVALCPFWLRRIELREARRRFDEALAAVPRRDGLRCEALLAAAAIAMRSGDLASSAEKADECEEIAREIGEPHAQWRALQLRGELAISSDAADQAILWLERARDLACDAGFAAGEAIGVYSLGVAYWILGRLPEAEEHLVRSIELFRADAVPADRIPSPVNIAEIRTDGLGGDASLPLVFEDTLQPFAWMSRDGAVSYALANQAGIARARGDLERARSLLEESAMRFDAARDEHGRAAVAVRRAYLDLSRHDPAAARAQLAQALRIRRDLGDRRGIGLTLSGLGLVETVMGDHHAADEHLTEARGLFRRAGDRWGLASTLWRTADLALARNSLAEADAALQEALDVIAATGRERWIATTLVGLAHVALRRGDAHRARALLMDARARYASRDDGRGVADVDARLAGLGPGRLPPLG